MCIPTRWTNLIKQGGIHFNLMLGIVVRWRPSRHSIELSAQGMAGGGSIKQESIADFYLMSNPTRTSENSQYAGENYSGINTLKRRLSGPGQHDRFALPGGS